MSVDYSDIIDYIGYGYEDTGYVFELVGESNTGFVQQMDVAKVVLSLIICIFGLSGNLVAIILIFVLKKCQSLVTHWYVLQLAFANFLFLLTLPFNVSEDLNNGFIYPEWMCKAKQTILFLNYYASILFLMIMSIDRYIEVCHTFSYGLQKLRNNISTSIIILFTWGISLLLCIPVMLYSHKIGASPNCKCSYVFPTEINQTALCIKEGFKTPEKLEQCLNLSRNNNPVSETGENHCVPVILKGFGIQDDDIPFATSNISTTFFTGLTGVDYSGTNLSISGGISEARDTSGIPVLHASCRYWEGPTRWTIYIAFNFAVFVILPIIMIIFYGLIFCLPSATRMASTSNPSAFSFTQLNTGEEKHLKTKKSPTVSDRDKRLLTIMCAALAASFVICWLPFHGDHLAKIVGIKTKYHRICEILPIIGLLLAYLNSAINPYLYIFLGSNIIGICKKKNINGNFESVTKQSADATISLKETQLFNAKETVPNDDTIQGSSPE